MLARHVPNERCDADDAASPQIQGPDAWTRRLNVSSLALKLNMQDFVVSSTKAADAFYSF